MELAEFVKNTLIEVVRGVTSAQEEMKGSGARINPHMRSILNEHTIGQPEGHGGQHVDYMNFDIAVTIQSGEEARGGAGIKVMGIGIGLDTSTGNSTSHVSRIAFKVPIMFPTQNK